jgi:Flp pilus assembly protein TadG
VVPRRIQRFFTRARDETGQAMGVFAIALVFLFAISAVVLDVGYAYLVDRRAQAAADASVLAAALALPDAGRAMTAAGDLATKNFPDGTVTVTITSKLSSNDTAEGRATASTPGFFASIFGIKFFEEGASATAQIGSYSGYANVIAPWATDKASLKFGENVQFKVAPGDQASSGTFGAVRLPLQGKNCGIANGANEYRKTINGTDHACLVQVDDMIASEPGNIANTGQALTDRGVVDNFDPNTLMTVGEDGVARLHTTTHPNLVVIPVIEAFTGGSGSVHVTGFAWFVITHYTKDTVEGMFVHSGVPGGEICPTATDPHAACPIGKYDPDGLKVISLVG